MLNPDKDNVGTAERISRWAKVWRPAVIWRKQLLAILFTLAAILTQAPMLYAQAESPQTESTAKADDASQTAADSKSVAEPTEESGRELVEESKDSPRQVIRVFRPTEEISADNAVPFPIDI